MTRVIKTSVDTASQVRTFAEARKAPAAILTPTLAVDPEIEALRAEVAQLQSALSEAAAKATSLRAEAQKAVSEAEARGREQGKQDAEDVSTRALAQLKSGIERGVGLLSEQTASMETLALLVARKGLSKVLGDDSQHHELVEEIIRRQVAGIRDQSVLKIGVSARDFAGIPDSLRDAAGPGVEVVVDNDLPAGGCWMQLQLGRIEAGLDQQWSALSRLLDEWAPPEHAP